MTGPMYCTDVFDVEPTEFSWDYLFDTNVMDESNLKGKVAMRDWTIAAFADARYYLGDDHPHLPSDLKTVSVTCSEPRSHTTDPLTTHDLHLKVIANKVVHV